MDKEIISIRQGIYMVAMFITGSFMVMNTGDETRQDIWIVILMAMAITIPMLLVFSYLLKLHPGKNLFEIFIDIYGKITGKILCLLYCWYAFHLGALVIRNFTEFVTTISFPETPQPIIAVFIGLLCIWIVKAGVEVIGRWSSFVFPLVAINIILTVALSTTKADMINLRPVLYNGIKTILPGTFAVFAFPLAESIIFTMVFDSLKDIKKCFRVLLIGTLIGCFFMVIIAVRNIAVLGVEYSIDLYFPSYVAVRTLNIGEIVQRFEVVVAITFILGGFIKISTCLYAAVKGFSKILNIDNYRPVSAPIGFLMMNLACILYSSLSEMFDWAINIYQYYALPFQVIIPIVTLIVAKVKAGLKNKKLVSSQP